MLNQDQNQGGKCRRTCATDQMLRKTVLPVIAIALCVLLFLAVSGPPATVTMAPVATSEPPSVARMPLPVLERPASLTDKQWLGKQLFSDPNLSTPAGLACAACHASQVGWTGPDAMINLGGAVYEGAVTGRFGNSKPPSSAYGGDSPILNLDTTNGWTGGMFWDGRATGLTLGDPLAEQAMQPFVNPLEQNNASAGVVVDKVKQSTYANLFLAVWGTNAFDDTEKAYQMICLLYTSDAADDLLCVDLGGRRIIKKKKNKKKKY